MAKKWKKTRTTLDRQFWQRYDETTRRLLERIEYHKRKAAEARAARDVASGDAVEVSLTSSSRAAKVLRL
jgi:hypothetical protein